MPASESGRNEPQDAESEQDLVLAVTSRHEGSRALIALQGELDFHSSDEVTAAVTQALEEPIESIEVEVSGLTFVDSAGLQSLLNAREAAQDAGVAFRLEGVSGQVERVIGLAGLGDVFL